MTNKKSEWDEDEIITIKYFSSIVSVRLSDLRTSNFIRIIDTLNDRTFEVSIEPSTTIIIEEETK